MDRKLQDHYHQLFLKVIKDNPGCDRQKIIDAGIPVGTVNLLIHRYEFSQIRIRRSRKNTKITGIWLKEDYPATSPSTL